MKFLKSTKQSHSHLEVVIDASCLCHQRIRSHQCRDIGTGFPPTFSTGLSSWEAQQMSCLDSHSHLQRKSSNQCTTAIGTGHADDNKLRGENDTADPWISAFRQGPRDWLGEMLKNTSDRWHFRNGHCTVELVCIIPELRKAS